MNRSKSSHPMAHSSISSLAKTPYSRMTNAQINSPQARSAGRLSVLLPVSGGIRLKSNKDL